MKLLANLDVTELVQLITRKEKCNRYFYTENIIGTSVKNGLRMNKLLHIHTMGC